MNRWVFVAVLSVVVDWMSLILRGREFQTEGAASENKRCPIVLFFLLLCAECVEFLSQRRSGAISTESRHEEDQTDKQELYQRKRSDRVLTTYTRYVLRWAASEKFWGRMKHGFVYELWGRVLQLSSALHPDCFSVYWDSINTTTSTSPHSISYHTVIVFAVGFVCLFHFEAVWFNPSLLQWANRNRLGAFFMLCHVPVSVD